MRVIAAEGKAALKVVAFTSCAEWLNRTVRGPSIALDDKVPNQVGREQIMQLRTRVIGAAGIAAVVAAGGSAFTASNTVPPKKQLGYGETLVSGAKVTGMAFDLGDSETEGDTINDVLHITYTLDPTDTNTKTPANSVIKVNAGIPGSLAPYDCVLTTASDPGSLEVPTRDPAPGLITCTTGGLTTKATQVVQLVVTPA